MEKCEVCGYNKQKRDCGLVCKNWKCYKFWKYGKTIEERLREKGFTGKIWIGNTLWLFETDKITDVTKMIE